MQNFHIFDDENPFESSGKDIDINTDEFRSWMMSQIPVEEFYPSMEEQLKRAVLENALILERKKNQFAIDKW